MSDGPPDDRSLDALLQALSHHRRRTLLSHLSDHDGSLTVADLAKLIAMDEQDADLADIDGDEIDAIRNELYHWHLPKLADCRAVTYEGDRGPVSTAERAASATSIIDSVGESI